MVEFFQRLYILFSIGLFFSIAHNNNIGVESCFPNFDELHLEGPVTVTTTTTTTSPPSPSPVTVETTRKKIIDGKVTTTVIQGTRHRRHCEYIGFVCDGPSDLRPDCFRYQGDDTICYNNGGKCVDLGVECSSDPWSGCYDIFDDRTNGGEELCYFEY